VSFSSGRYTFLQLRCRLRQVATPSSGSVVVFVRSLYLPPVLSSSSSGRSTSLWLRRRLCQLGRPPPDFTSGMKASLWGARLLTLSSISGCLGAFCLETFLRSACLEWLYQTLCSYARYLGVSALHSFIINRFLALSSTDLEHRNFSYDIIDNLFMKRTFLRS
jgi:hypothetical protein